MAHNPKSLTPIEAALDRRTNQNGMVEYLVKLHEEDKLQWVPWTNISCPQLMVGEQAPHQATVPATTTDHSTSSPSPSGIIDI